MYKSPRLVLFLFLLSVSFENLYSQAPSKGVKSVRVSATGYGDNGDSTPVFISDFTEYDAKGRMTEQQTYFTNQLIFNRPTDSSSQVYYNYKGGLYAATPQKTEIHQYNEKDSLVFEEYKGASYFMQEDDQRKYIYDAAGKLSEIQFYEDAKLARKETCNYNAQGLMTKRFYNVLAYPEYSSKEYYHYDNKNNLVSYAERGNSGKLKDTCSYKYDSQNRRISSLKWKEKNRLEDSTVITYSDQGKTVESFRPDAWRGDLPMSWRHTITKYDLQNKELSKVETRYHITYVAELKTAPAFSTDSTKKDFWPNGNIKTIARMETRNDKTYPHEISRFNQDGNLLEHKYYQDEKLWMGENYVYDANGKQISETTSGYGQQNYIIVNSNNAKGLPLVQCVYTPGGRLLQKYFYEYEYY